MADTALFSTAEARAFEGERLKSPADFPAADITAKEVEIRELFTRICGVHFIPTTVTDEYHDGDGTGTLFLGWPLVSSVSAASYRSPGDSTWTPLVASELAVCSFNAAGVLDWESGIWPKGRRTVKVTYACGHAAVPKPIKRAALLVAANEIPLSMVSGQATSGSVGEISYTYLTPGANWGFWKPLGEVNMILAQYMYRSPGIA